MLTLGIRYLHGVAVASHGEHNRVEWPPHPARVFMAMVAAHYQTGADRAERIALEWLEQQSAPEIHAPEVEPGCVVKQYVPVNDKAGPAKAQIQSLPLTRHRIDRTFARASLASDIVALHWPDATPLEATRTALAALCAKVTRIGHSSSLVQMWVAGSPPKGLPCWVEDDAHGTHRFRVPREGTLEEVLDASFSGEAVARYCELRLAVEDAANAKAKAAAKKALEDAFPEGDPPRQDRPRISTYASYARKEDIATAPPVPGTVFSPHLAIFTLERHESPYRSLDLACTLALTDRWREAIASHANDLPPEAQSLVTGHAPDRSTLLQPHVAFLPLGVVGHPHADGHLPGLALALPTDMPPDVRRDVLRAASRIPDLKLGRLGVWKLAPATMARPLDTLRAATWTAHPSGATHWSTVTPIAYDQHPKAKDKAAYIAEATELIAAACERVVRQRPREVIITPVSAHLGAPPAHAFPRLRRKDGTERRHTHAILIFNEPVRGPVLLGAGRYRGYGLCRPVEFAG